MQRRPNQRENREALRGPIDNRVIGQIVDRLSKRLPDCCIVLFGSRAYGTPTSQSDVDLLVVAPSQRDPYVLCGELHRELSPRDFSVDLLVMTPETFRQRRSRFDPFFAELTSKGRVLHGHLP
ncbi:MAG: hypothetical protein CHACPFDD_03407 [Phycisphaerae bacterium]|nr:hypothetical protein [Phycisphaerae bacterium]